LTRRFALLIASALTISSCSSFQGGTPTAGQLSPTWPPATGTVLAQTAYGRITSVDSGGFSIELRETPLPPERTEAQRAGAIAAITQFALTTDLTLTYRGLQRHPENTGLVVEVYDSSDAQFMVDIRTNAVVYMQPLVGPMRVATGSKLSEPELEAQAKAFLSNENPCFETIVGWLQLDPGNKGDNYFFRWHSPNPNADRPWNQPTFVQISIDAFGRVFGYSDSGICDLVGE